MRCSKFCHSVDIPNHNGILHSLDMFFFWIQPIEVFILQSFGSREKLLEMKVFVSYLSTLSSPSSQGFYWMYFYVAYEGQKWKNVILIFLLKFCF